MDHPMTTEDYLKLLSQEYPEELGVQGFVPWMWDCFRYMDEYPEQWVQMPKWVREAWPIDPVFTTLKYSYEFLESFY